MTSCDLAASRSSAPTAATVRISSMSSNCETVAHGVEWNEVTADVQPRGGGRFAVTCREYDGEPLACATLRLDRRGIPALAWTIVLGERR